MEIRALAISWCAELLKAAALAVLLRGWVAALTRVRGTSMQPTLPDGAWLLVAVWPARLRRIRRGDVVICRYPGRGRQLFVKRAVGLPGDRVWRADGVTYVNGKALDAGFRWFLPDYPPYVLSRDEYFCVGDNRRNSHDSRDWRRKGSRIVGPVDGRMLAGVVRCVIWPPRAMGPVSRRYAPEKRTGARMDEMGDDGRT